MEHLLVVWGFESYLWVLSDEMSAIVGNGGWRVARGIWKCVKEVKVALLLGKDEEGVSDNVMEEVGEYVMYWICKRWQRRKNLLYGG